MTEKKTVLLAEDEEPVRRIIRSELEKKGLVVYEAHDGEVANKLVFEKKPDIILLDVLMPKMHGMDLLQRLKEDAWGKEVPVILLTNFADDPRVVAAVTEGRAELLNKAETKLDDIVKKVMEKLA